MFEKGACETKELALALGEISTGLCYRGVEVSERVFVVGLEGEVDVVRGVGGGAVGHNDDGVIGCFVVEFGVAEDGGGVGSGGWKGGGVDVCENGAAYGIGDVNGLRSPWRFGSRGRGGLGRGC